MGIMKDPAVLFYFQDFLVGTEFMTDDEVGKYIRILCHQADKGPLTEYQVKKICKNDVVPEAILSKLMKDENGNYYQKRMQTEREKRNNYIESRRHNRSLSKKNIRETYDKRMENENENINNSINVAFLEFWNLYNKKIAKVKCEKKWNKLKDKEREEIMNTLPKFLKTIKDKQYQPYPETYLNQQRWEDELPEDETAETWDIVNKAQRG